MATICGGFSNDKEVTEAEQRILDSVKGDVEGRLNKSFSTFKAISYQSQVVAGKNYSFKVQVDDNIIHVKVHQPLPHTQKGPQLMEVG